MLRHQRHSRQALAHLQHAQRALGPLRLAMPSVSEN